MIRLRIAIAAVILAALPSSGCLPPPETPPASPAASVAPRASTSTAQEGPFVGAWVFVESTRSQDAKGRQVAARTEIWREGEGYLVEQLLPGQVRGRYAVPFEESAGRLVHREPGGKVTDELRVMPSSGHLVWRTSNGEVVEYRRP